MSKRTWICVPCRKAYLRKKSLAAVECPKCHGPCEWVRWAFLVPSPQDAKAWEIFIAQHLADKVRAEAIERAERERKEMTVPSRPPAKPPEDHIPYLEAIAAPLIKTLNHSAGLPTNQVAGHAANLEFWVGEAQHSLAVIDGYWIRLERLRAGQAEYEKKHDVAESFPLRSRIMDSWRQELRRRVSEAIERFLSRCHHEGLLSARALKEALAKLEK